MTKKEAGGKITKEMGPIKKEDPKPKKLTKKRLAQMTPEQAEAVTAAAVEARRQARLKKKWDQKVEEEDLQQSKKKKKEVQDEFWTVEETVFEPKQGWIVVLTPDGKLYQEPIPRYSSIMGFAALVCALPKAPKDMRVKMEINLSCTEFKHGWILTGTFDGSVVRNSYAEYFDLKNETKIVSGNIVFTGKDEKSLTRAQADKVVKWVVDKIGKGEEIFVDKED